MSTSEFWTPALGDTVWMNHPDGGELGKVIGFVTDEMPNRVGQPIIEAQHDKPGMFGQKAGERSVIHPMFLLPFEYGGDEWKRAEAAGRIGTPTR